MARWVRGVGVAWTGAEVSLFPGVGGFLAVVICVAAVAAVAMALCAWHSRKEDKTGGGSMDSPPRSLGSFNLAPKSPGRALLNSLSSKKLLLSRKWGPSDEEELKSYDQAHMNGGELFLWQRNILMGERCQPPDFAGVIIYDHKGNRLSQFPPRSPKQNLFHPSSLQASVAQQG